MELLEKSKISINSDCTRIGEYLYSKSENSIFFELTYPFKVQLKITDWWKVEYTPGFKWLWTILRGGINLDILCRELDLIRYIQEDKLMLHASCVSGFNSCSLIVGFPNAGKTYNTFKSVSEGCDLISEEYTIVHKGVASAYKDQCRSCLSAKTIKACGFKTTLKQKIELFLNTIRAKLMPFLFEAVIWQNFDVSGKSAKINQIVYGSSDTLIKDAKKLMLLTENEFPFMGEAILEAYAFASGFDLIAIQEKQRQLMEDFVCSLS